MPNGDFTRLNAGFAAMKNWLDSHGQISHPGPAPTGGVKPVILEQGKCQDLPPDVGVTWPDIRKDLERWMKSLDTLAGEDGEASSTGDRT